MATLVSFLFFKLGGPITHFLPDNFSDWAPASFGPFPQLKFREKQILLSPLASSPTSGLFLILCISPHPLIPDLPLPWELKFREKEMKRETERNKACGYVCVCVCVCVCMCVCVQLPKFMLLPLPHSSLNQRSLMNGKQTSWSRKEVGKGSQLLHSFPYQVNIGQGELNRG